MTGAVLQLAAHGAEDTILIGEPKITMFKTVYRRHGLFSIEDLVQPMTGSGEFATIYETEVERSGDLLGQQFLQIDLDQLYMERVGNVSVLNRLSALGYSEANISDSPTAFNTLTATELADWFANKESEIQLNIQLYKLMKTALAQYGIIDHGLDDLNAILPYILSGVDITDIRAKFFQTIIDISDGLDSQHCIPPQQYNPTPLHLTYRLALSPKNLWVQSIPTSNIFIDVAHLNNYGIIRELSLKTTNLVEIQQGLKLYLLQKIVQGVNTDINFTRFVNTVALTPVANINYGALPMATIFDNLFQGISNKIFGVDNFDYHKLDTYKAYKFVIRDTDISGLILSSITATDISNLIRRLDRIVPAVPYFHANLVMNTLTTLGSLYGNIAFYKATGKSLFEEILADSSGSDPWKMFNTGNLNHYLTRDYYMATAMHRTGYFLLSGSPTIEYFNTPYTDIINNNLASYKANQSVITKHFADFDFTALRIPAVVDFESACYKFRDIWTRYDLDCDPSTLPNINPLNPNYLKSRFNLTNPNYSSFVDCSSDKVVYLNATMLYLIDQFKELIMYRMGDTLGYAPSADYLPANGNSDQYIGFLHQSTVAYYDLIASQLFPLPFDKLYNDVQFSMGTNAESGTPIIYVFLKNTTIGIVEISQLFIDTLLNFETFLISLASLTQDQKDRVPIVISTLLHTIKQNMIIYGNGIFEDIYGQDASAVNDNSAPFDSITSYPLNIPNLTFEEEYKSPTFENSAQIAAIPVQITMLAPNWDGQLALLAQIVDYYSVKQRENYNALYKHILLNRQLLYDTVGAFSYDLMTTGLGQLTSIQDVPESEIVAAIVAVDNAIKAFDDDLGYYSYNRALLSLNDLDPTINTVDWFFARLGQSGATLSNPDYGIRNIYESQTDEIIQQELTEHKNNHMDHTIVPYYFNWVDQTFYTVGYLYDDYKARFDAAAVENNWNPNMIQESIHFLRSISPKEMFLLLESSQVLDIGDIRHTFEYLLYVLKQTNDGVGNLSGTSAFRSLIDINVMIAIINERLALLTQTLKSLQNIYSEYLRLSNQTTAAYAWIQRLGFLMIDSVSVYFNGERYDKHTGEWLNIWAEMMLPVGHRSVVAKLIGDIPDLNTYNGESKPGYRLYVPLFFWYNRYPGWYLPLVALCHTRITVEVKLKPWEDCVVSEIGMKPITLKISKGGAQVPIKKVEAPRVKMQLMSRYIFLDETERAWFAQQRHEYLIDYVEMNSVHTISSHFYAASELTVGQRFYVQVMFNNPCRALFWTLRHETESIKDLTMKRKPKREPDIFTLNDPVALAKFVSHQNALADPTREPDEEPLRISKCQIKMNGITREGDKSAGFFEQVESLEHHPTAARIHNLYSYNFTLRNYLGIQPSGACNMSKIDDIGLYMSFTPKTLTRINNGDPLYVNVYGLQQTVVRIMSGMIGRTFFH